MEDGWADLMVSLLAAMKVLSMAERRVVRTGESWGYSKVYWLVYLLVDALVEMSVA